MRAKISTTIQATNGYKTKGAVFFYLLFQLFSNKIPLTPGQQEIVINIVELIMASGLFHDFWRNREMMIEWIKNLFTNKKLVS